MIKLLDKENRRRQENLANLIKLANLSDEEVEKLNFRDKQRYYAARSKVGKLVHKSANGNTYKRNK